MNAKKYKWPTDSPKIITVNGNFQILEQKYAALSQESDNPYSRICFVRSCISLEAFRGCPLDCIYCAANNDFRSINFSEKNEYTNRKNIKIRTPERLFSSKDLLISLVKHPAFIRNKSVISFCSGSTEVFHPLVEDDIWEAMKLMVSLNLKNPIWLVVKSFISKKEDIWVQRFQYLISNGIKVIISISDAGLSNKYEPFQIENRFVAFQKFANIGVYLSHHLRPLFLHENVFEEIKKALGKSKNMVSSICVGGLRYDPGMEYYWKGLTNSCYKPGNQNKSLDDNLLQYVKNIIEDSIPIFCHSSMMLSYYLNIVDYGMNQHIGENLEFISNLSDLINDKFNIKKVCQIFTDIAHKIELYNISFYSSNGKIHINGTLEEPDKNALIQAIGFSDFWQSKEG